MNQEERRFTMEPFELPEGTIVRVSSEYVNHIHLTDPYGGEVNLPVRDTHLAMVRLFLRLVSFLPLGPRVGQGEGAPAYRDLRRRTVQILGSL